jgi:hypothetical protein
MHSITIGMAIATTTFILSPGVPGVLKPALGSVYIALSSVMACRVYRVILGALTDFQDSHLKTKTILSFYRTANNIRDERTHTSSGNRTIAVIEPPENL